MSNKKRLINDEIKARKVQLITEEGENLWEMSLKEAKALASQKELDLMEIWKKENISIVKMLDYWKFLYRQKKQEQKQKQKWKAPDLKTIRITFKMSDHDMQTRINQVIKFAKNWHPLKLTLMLRWRENHYSDLALEKMQTFIEKIEDYYKLDNPIKKNWNTFIAMLKVKK